MEKAVELPKGRDHGSSADRAVLRDTTRLHGHGSRIARLIYLISLGFLLVVFFVGLPTRFNVLASGPVGVKINQNLSGEHILSPIPGMPAGQAGLQAGDILIAIDGTPVKSDVSQVLTLLAGPPGSPVTLEVRRGDENVQQFTFKRQAFALEAYGISSGVYALYLIVVGVILVLGYSIPALIITLRKPDDWLAMFVSFTLVLIAVTNSHAFTGSHFLPNPLAYAMDIAYNVFVFLVLLIFPDGHFVPSWTRRFLGIGLLWNLIKVLPSSLNVTLFSTHVWILIDVVIYGVAIYAQIYRYRKVSDADARQQTKWITFGIAIAFVAHFTYWMLREFVPAFIQPTAEGLIFQLVGVTLYHLFMLLVPLAFTYAILRHRLYQIDLIINRTLVYVPLSAIVAGIYTASVTLFKGVFVTVTGETSDVAIVLATLVIVALITPLKDWLQGFVNRRFKDLPRPAKILHDFEAQVRGRMYAVDPGQILRRVLEKMVEAFEAKYGAAYVENKGEFRCVHTLGVLDVDAALNLVIGNEGKHYGKLTLGAKRGGGSYTNSDLKLLQGTAAIVSQAIEEDWKL
jgi:hypothetical protein